MGGRKAEQKQFAELSSVPSLNFSLPPTIFFFPKGISANVAALGNVRFSHFMYWVECDWLLYMGWGKENLSLTER